MLPTPGIKCLSTGIYYLFMVFKGKCLDHDCHIWPNCDYNHYIPVCFRLRWRTDEVICSYVLSVEASALFSCNFKRICHPCSRRVKGRVTFKTVCGFKIILLLMVWKFHPFLQSGLLRGNPSIRHLMSELVSSLRSKKRVWTNLPRSGFFSPA